MGVQAESKFVFLIFEGGGAKGIAHLGALRAIEDLEYHVAGVAGASAGAFVAALVAAGYRSDELLDIASPVTNLLTASGLEDPTSLLGASAWSSMSRLRAAVRWIKIGALVAGVPGAAALVPCLVPTIARLCRSRGHFETSLVRDFVNDRIREHLCDLWANAGDDPARVPRDICFADLDYERFKELRPLKIVATNIDDRKPMLFDRTGTPNVIIGDAVAASIAIPLVFKPVTVRSRHLTIPGALVEGDKRFVDGGLVSNLPSWVFMDEKLALERTLKNNPPVPIVAFALVDAPSKPGQQQTAKPERFWDYLIGIGRTAIFGSQSISQNFLRDLTVINLPTALDVLEFDAPWSRIRADYLTARQTAKSQVTGLLINNPAAIRAWLRLIAEGVTDRINTHRAANRWPRISQLRASLIEPFGERSLRVTHGFNMDTDADDRLPMDIVSNHGAAIAWRTRDIARVSPAGPLTEDGMSKYERALMRRTLQSGLCVPIFNALSDWRIAEPLDRPTPRGVLVLDSDEDLSEEFLDPGVVNDAIVGSVQFRILFKRT